MASHEEHENNGFSIRELFRQSGKYVRENKLEALALGTSLAIGGLMATTSLVSPLLASPWVAATALAGSIYLLLQNGKTTVSNTLGLGKKLGMSAMTLGMIVGSLNTVPEVLVSLSSVLEEAYELGLGNVVGSHIAHTLLILGVTAAAVGIARARDLSWKFNTYVMAGAAGLFSYQLMLDKFSPYIGGAMLAMGGLYLWKKIRRGREENRHTENHDHDENETCSLHDHDDEENAQKANERPKWFNAMLACAGMAGLLSASHLIVQSGIQFADTFNTAALGFDFNQATVGAVIIALGTAAPEIAISIQAVRQRASDLAVGNILGCSITNMLIAGGVLSLVGGIAGAAVPETFSMNTDLGMLNFGVFAGTTAALTALLLATRGAVSKLMGGIALTAYFAYIAASMYLSNGENSGLHNHDPAEDKAGQTSDEDNKTYPALREVEYEVLTPSFG